MADDNLNNMSLFENEEFIQLIDDLARMESRITVLEDKINEININDESKEKMNKDSIIYNGDKYICVKFVKNEPCIVKGFVRNIGFDICINDDSCCNWAFKIE